MMKPQTIIKPKQPFAILVSQSSTGGYLALPAAIIAVPELEMYSKPFRNIALDQNYTSEALACAVFATALLIGLPLYAFSWATLRELAADKDWWVFYLMPALLIFGWWRGLLGQWPLFQVRRYFRTYVTNPSVEFCFAFIVTTMVIGFGNYMAASANDFQGVIGWSNVLDWLPGAQLVHMTVELLMVWAALIWAFRLDLIKWRLYDAEPEEAEPPPPQPWGDQEDGWHEQQGI